jgi:putative oxidoreductase
MKEGCEKLKPFASLFLRIGLGTVFAFHGYPKVFGEGAALGTAWAGDGYPAIIQVLVSWGEFVGGLAILAGFLTPLAALGIIIIMAGAIVTVHGKNGFSMGNGGYEYNFVLISMCLALIANGPGAFAVDNKLCCKKGSCGCEGKS